MALTRLCIFEMENNANTDDKEDTLDFMQQCYETTFFRGI